MRERKLRRDDTVTAYTSNGRAMPAIARSDKSASKGEPSKGAMGIDFATI